MQVTQFIIIYNWSDKGRHRVQRRDVDDQQSGPVNGCETESKEDKGEPRATCVYLPFHSRIFLTHKLIY